MTTTMTAETTATFLWPADENGVSVRRGAVLAAEMTTRLHEYIQDLDITIPDDVDDRSAWGSLYRVLAEDAYQSIMQAVFGAGLFPEGFVFAYQLPDGRYVVEGPSKFANLMTATAITEVPVTV